MGELNFKEPTLLLEAFKQLKFKIRFRNFETAIEKENMMLILASHRILEMLSSKPEDLNRKNSNIIKNQIKKSNKVYPVLVKKIKSFEDSIRSKVALVLPAHLKFLHIELRVRDLRHEYENSIRYLELKSRRRGRPSNDGIPIASSVFTIHGLYQVEVKGRANKWREPNNTETVRVLINFIKNCSDAKLIHETWTEYGEIQIKGKIRFASEDKYKDIIQEMKNGMSEWERKGYDLFKQQHYKYQLVNKNRKNR
jgi:hypothetical protein